MGNATQPRRALASPAELAEHLGVPPGTLPQWRLHGNGPRWFRIGRHVRYDWADVDAWLAERASGGSRAQA